MSDQEHSGPKKKWGTAILLWAMALFVLFVVAEVYTAVKYQSMSNSLGAEIKPTQIITPWWAQLLCFGFCLYVGKRFLGPKDK